MTVFQGAVSLEELTGPEELVEKIESIILPNQISSSIREPLFRDFLNLCPSEHAGRRLDDWLTAYLEDQLHQSRNARALASPFEQVLRDLTDYGRDRGRLPSRMAVFLQEYFDSGLQLIDPEILSDLLLYSSESLPDLSGFESSVLDGSESSLRQLLKLQIQLIVREAHKPADPSGATSSETDVMGIANLCTKSLNLSIAIIETFPNSQQGISAVLSALELMSASMISSAVAIIPPPPLLVYRLLFEPSVSVVSRLCGVLNNYKVAMEEHDSEKAVVGEGVADILNSYLMDVCNCLWRNRAFSLGDLHAKACLMDPGSVDTLRKYLDEMDVDVPLQSALSFSHNPTLALISKRIVEEWLHDYEGMQDGVPRWNLGPVTQKSLDRMRSEGGPQLNWQQFRGLFLRWLDQRGLEGLGSLIRATIQGA